jgi:phosphoribosyl 1,2-cyclic phosphodiesterase
MNSKLRFASLQSGSNGNCFYVESGNVRLLFDAGLTGLKTKVRLESIGIDIMTIDAVIISHAHSDHIYYAGTLQRQYYLPIWMSNGSHQKMLRTKRLGRVKEPNLFSAGDTLIFDNAGDTVKVETIPTTHDAPEGVCFVIDNGTVRLGVMTDLGSQFLGLREAIKTLDGLYIESNYDPEMLANGFYSDDLKQRIQGDQGHLSNLDSAELIVKSERLRWACLGHLSPKNNTPDIALETHRTLLGEAFQLHIAPRHGVSKVLEL